MRSRTRILQLASLIGLVLFAQVARATPLAYDEAISGDLGFSFPATVFTLDVGANTVKGTTHFFTSNSNTDFDQFAIVVPVGMQVTDITYTFQTQTLPGTNTTVAKSEYRLDNGNATPVAPFLASLNIDLLGASPVHPFGSGLPLGPGTFAVSQFSVTSTGDGGGWTADYSWTITVEDTGVTAVPEPATLCLFGTGLALAAVRRRRQSRR